MNDHPNTQRSSPANSRREFLWNLGGGLGGIALAQLLAENGLLAQDHAAKDASQPAGGLHHPAKAKRVVQFFMSGAASQCDMFDYKPELIQPHGQPFDPGEKVELFQSKPGDCMASPWAWKQYGQCGKWMSDLVPHLAGCVDDMAFIHSMVSKSNVHGPATFMQNTGFVLPGFPSMGAWISYGLGSLTDNLPTFVVLPDARGFPPNGPGNWSAGFLAGGPPGHDDQAGGEESDRRSVSARRRPLRHPPKRRRGLAAAQAAECRAPGEPRRRLAARRPDRLATNWPPGCNSARRKCSTSSGETEATRRLYGLDQKVTEDFGRNCLIARRLLERGVRFVQVWSGADNGFPRRNWD